MPLRVPVPDPTGNAATRRASRPDPHRLPATPDQLRTRVLTAVATGDGVGLRVLARHLARSGQ